MLIKFFDFASQYNERLRTAIEAPVMPAPNSVQAGPVSHNQKSGTGVPLYYRPGDEILFTSMLIYHNSSRILFVPRHGELEVVLLYSRANDGVQSTLLGHWR